MKLWKKKNVLEFGLIVVVLLIGLSSFIFISIHEREPGYELLPLLPIFYVLAASFVLIRSLVYDFKMFNFVFTIISGLRYVILPFFLVYADYYGGRSPVSPTARSYDLALKLMLYELIVVTIVILILDGIRKKKVKRLQPKTIQRSPSIFIYTVFSIVAVVAVAVVPGALQSVSFLVPTERIVGVLKTIPLSSALALYMFIIMKQVITILLMWFFYQKHKVSGKQYFVYLAALAMVINIGIFAGTNRSDLLICASASLAVFRILFPSDFKKIAFLVVAGVGAVIVLIASIRQIASVSGDASKLIDFTDTMQVYLGGPYNVAMAIEMKNMFPEASHWSVLLYDIFRPMIGINIFIKDLPIDYSVIYYNERYFFKDHVTQILPMIGQGNLYFGYLFAPLIPISVTSLAYYLQAKMERIGSIEIIYFLTLSVSRIGFFMGQNTMNMVNDMSYNLVLFLLIYFINRRIVFRQKQRRYLNYD
ncbi:hypothetical protein [Listeria booriae]|uniref:Capsular biosynthesis protein n=1 Tax=Listeria booriae TaxID=1552123 RepID=A0A841ZXU1_9LIST|nr:hypothetical protein [Listeria booriae]MBC1565090.1 hypothetical protein [Listeria booriae]